MRNLRIALVIVFITVVAAMANDTALTLGAGGLVPRKSSSVAMVSEDLTISTHAVRVDYVFRNDADDLTAIIGFPLPEISGSALWIEPVNLPSKDAINFMQFKVLVNGRPITPQAEVRAYLDNGTEITSRIRSLGLPVSVVAGVEGNREFTSAVDGLPAKVRSDIAKELLVVGDDYRDPVTREMRDAYWPNWNTRIQFFWRQRFPAHRNIKVRHTYRPIVGGSYITNDNDGSLSVQPYCGGSSALAAIKKVKERLPAARDVEIQLWERRVQYILTTANNWNGPIRRFHLSVVADSPEDIVLTCMQGLQRVGPTRYELARTNFRPDKDLDLLILQANRGDK